MNSSDVKEYFEKAAVISDYARACVRVGLWESEKIIFSQCFKKDEPLLELGCGAGRIAHNLYMSGFDDITAFDISEGMIAQAKELSEILGDKVRYMALDALQMDFERESFGGAIFGFNGLMQIPGRENRRAVMKKVCALLKKGAYFVFTTHDRSSARNAEYWRKEAERWQSGRHPQNLEDFGDIYYKGEHGRIFIHSPLRDEIIADLEYAGLNLVEDITRCAVAPEPDSVREFADECIFWITRKPL